MNQAPAAAAPTGLAQARALCASKLATDDLGLYHSVLFLPAPQREAATALYAFWLEVREINDECSDPGVALTKLGWWQEEIERMFAGGPRHPVAVALADVAKRYALPAPPFRELLAALGRHVSAPGYATFDALRAHGRDTRGRVDALALGLTGGDAAAAAGAREVGALLELTELLRDAGANARRGRVYLPREDFDRHGIAPADINATRAAEPAQRLLATAADRLSQELERATDALPEQRRPLRSLLVAAWIARAVLRLMQRQPERVLRERVRLPPLRQLWIAWRAARAAV